MAATKEMKSAMNFAAQEAAKSIGECLFEGCFVSIFHNGSHALAITVRDHSKIESTLRASHVALLDLMKRYNVEPDSGDAVANVNIGINHYNVKPDIERN